jgi:hypothetical protein
MIYADAAFARPRVAQPAAARLAAAALTAAGPSSFSRYRTRRLQASSAVSDFEAHGRGAHKCILKIDQLWKAARGETMSKPCIKTFLVHEKTSPMYLEARLVGTCDRTSSHLYG